MRTRQISFVWPHSSTPSSLKKNSEEIEGHEKGLIFEVIDPRHSQSFCKFGPPARKFHRALTPFHIFHLCWPYHNFSKCDEVYEMNLRFLRICWLPFFSITDFGSLALNRRRTEVELPLIFASTPLVRRKQRDAIWIIILEHLDL